MTCTICGNDHAGWCEAPWPLQTPAAAREVVTVLVKGRGLSWAEWEATVPPPALTPRKTQQHDKRTAERHQGPAEADPPIGRSDCLDLGW